MNDKRYILPSAVLVICATVAILYWQLIYLPVESEISRLNAETKQIETLENELKQLQTRYKNFESVVELAEERLLQMQEYLPAEMNAEKFISDLYNLAEDKKILINSVQAGEVSEKNSVQWQQIKIRLESDYISLLNFIREILDGERLTSFENFSIARDGESNILNCEVEFVIFAANLRNVAE